MCGYSLKSLQMVLQQQSMVLQQIAEKLDVNVDHQNLLVPPTIPQNRLSISPMDGGHYGVGADPLQVGRGSTVVERPRWRSVRITVDKTERPPSTVL